MIAIVSSNPTERSAFATLCDSQKWPHLTCESVRTLRAILRHTAPSVVVVRNKLDDGYSDDVLAALKNSSSRRSTRVIVLLAAGTASAHEARQVALGADCVHRDPARVDVLLEYLARYRKDRANRTTPPSRRPVARTIRFAGAILRPADRQIDHGGRTTTLTPREVAFVELLAERPNEVVSYHTLYAELLGRRFAGDTSNLRVLLGKLDATFRKVGVSVRDWIEVIPKTGHRYHSGRRRSG